MDQVGNFLYGEFGYDLGVEGFNCFDIDIEGKGNFFGVFVFGNQFEYFQLVSCQVIRLCCWVNVCQICIDYLMGNGC